VDLCDQRRDDEAGGLVDALVAQVRVGALELSGKEVVLAGEELWELEMIIISL
jgi:hypothetical protein